MKNALGLLLSGLVGALSIAACIGDAPTGEGACTATQKACGAKCVGKDDPLTGCATDSCSPCSVPANASAVCKAGVCGSDCVTGFTDCDGNPANGCEAKVTTDPVNCGACNNTCGSANTSSPSRCEAGKCVITCSPNFAHCGADAAGCDTDLRTSATDCGACGHSCGGGTCTAGKCDPIKLTSAVTPSGIAVDATNVYYTMPSSDTVMRIGKDGKCLPASPCPQIVAQGALPNIRGPEAIVSDATNVYWTAAAASKIGWIPTTGGTVNGFGAAPNAEPGALAIGGGKIWWVSGGGTNRLQKANLDGTGIATVATGINPGRGNAVVDATNVYWTNNQGSIYSAAFGDATCAETSTCKVITGASSPVGVAVDGTYVYWTSPTGSSVGRALKGGGLTAYVATNQDVPQAIVADATHVYWGNIGTGAGTGSSIRRAPLAGGTCAGNACELFQTVTSPNAIAIDDKAIYWVDKTANGGVYKVMK